VPLTGVTVEAEISNLCAPVTVGQRYINTEPAPIEAVYVFPLDGGSAVCGFEAIVDGTLVVGEVKERDEAFRIYDEAMEQGHGASLLTIWFAASRARAAALLNSSCRANARRQKSPDNWPEC
jgi:vault protein inter-alpha-trypsin-like protein